MEVIDDAGGGACDCPEGRVRKQGICQTLFSRGLCLPGRILVPQQFLLDEESETETCPEDFSCKHSTDCESFENTKNDLNQLSQTVREP